MNNTYILLIEEEAKVDISAAFYWYEDRQKGLGERFITVLDDCFNTILKNPGIYAKKYGEMRQAIVKKFPYVVIYEIENSKIIVYSVFNTNQDPEKWLERIF